MAAAVVAFALARPVGVAYWDTNGAPLVHQLAANAHDDDPVMLSATGRVPGRLLRAVAGNDAAHGHELAGDRRHRRRATGRSILPRSARDGTLATEFLHRFRSSDRVWYLGHRLRSDRVVAAMKKAGYTVETVRASTDYRLFRGRR